MRKIFLFLVVTILCFQLISATDTNIHIKTVPFKNVNVIVLSSSMEVYEKFNKDANEYGDVSLIFSSDKVHFNLNIFVKDISTNKKVASEVLEDQDAGGDIYVEVIPEGFNIIETPQKENASTENLVNNSANETEDTSSNNSLVTTEENEENSKISGKAIFGENSNLKRIMIYVGGAIVLVVIIFFVFKFFKKRKGGEIKVKKLSDWKEEQKDTPKEYYGVLEETQRKLEETQKELNMVKNKERIKETEEKLKRDEQELRSLRGF